MALSAPFPGVSRVFEEGENCGLWTFVKLEGGRLTIPPAATYILGAWHPDYQRMLNMGQNVGVLWTSSIGEMVFEPVEWQYLYQILQDPRIAFIWFGQKELADLFPEKGFFAPYPMDFDSIEPPPTTKQDIITLFCPAGPKKNIGNQLAAVALLQKERELVLHTNCQAYEPLMQVLGLRYVMHPWLPRQEYYRLLAQAKVNLACSWAETFNYQVAEALLLGTRSVITSTIPLPGFIVRRPNSPRNIAEAIADLAAESPPNSEEMAGLRAHLADQNKQLRDELTRHFPGQL